MAQIMIIDSEAAASNPLVTKLVAQALAEGQHPSIVPWSYHLLFEEALNQFLRAPNQMVSEDQVQQLIEEAKLGGDTSEAGQKLLQLLNECLEYVLEFVTSGKYAPKIWVMSFYRLVEIAEAANFSDPE